LLNPDGRFEAAYSRFDEASPPTIRALSQ